MTLPVDPPDQFIDSHNEDLYCELKADERRLELHRQACPLYVELEECAECYRLETAVEISVEALNKYETDWDERPGRRDRR